MNQMRSKPQRNPEVKIWEVSKKTSKQKWEFSWIFKDRNHHVSPAALATFFPWSKQRNENWSALQKRSLSLSVVPGDESAMVTGEPNATICSFFSLFMMLTKILAERMLN